jgi:hypothetical protein
MSQTPDLGSLVGEWTYRSFLNDADLTTSFNDLQFGLGTIAVEPAPMGVFKGRIFGPGWALTLNGSISYGYPGVLRFQGRGLVAGEEWVYDYLGFVVPAWPNGIDQVPAMTGTIVRTVPHASGTGGVAPAGVVCSWIAVWQGALPSES